MKTGRAKAALAALSVALVVALLFLTIAVLPDFLVDHDLAGRPAGDLTPADLLKAKNDVRTTLLQGLAGAVLLLGAYLTWRQIQVTRQGQLEEAHRSLEGQITERFRAR